MPSKPDMAKPTYELAVFVDDEFWHGHKWQTRKKNKI
jgi:DNA mismatch endonuclease (patch repair protein)